MNAAAMRETPSPFLKGLAGRWLRAAEVGLAAGFLALYAYTAIRRVSFPFDLNWGEGAFVDHVVRLVKRQQLYVAPSINFTPFVYTPGYYYVAAAAARVFGASVRTLRSVSILCSFGTFWVLAAFGRRERGSVTDGVVLAGVFAATYVIGGTWFDIARVDSLFLLLTIAAIYLLRFGETRSAMVTAGLLLAGALLTKQVTLIIAPILLLLPLLRFGKRGLIAPTTFAVATLLAVGLLERLNKGWFLYYTFFGPMRWKAGWAGHLISFWTIDLLLAFPIATILGLGWCLAVWRVAARDEAAFYTICGAALVAAAWGTRLQPGANANTILPAYLFLAIASTRAARWLDSRAPGVGPALVLAQLALLSYNPHRLIPSQADRAAAEALIDRLRAVPGEVMMLDHGYFPTLAGKRTHAHEMAIRDVLTIDDKWAAALRTEFREALATERYDLIVQDTPDWFPVPLTRYYRLIGLAPRAEDVLWMHAGNEIRPEYLYGPRRRRVDGE